MGQNIIENGKFSNFTIVASENSTPSVETAISLLKEYMKKSMGADLEIEFVSFSGAGKNDWESFKSEANIILLYPEDLSALEEDLGPEISDLGSDGYFFKSNGHSLIISGSGERGILYGVIAFLEEYMGIGFYHPDFIYVPSKKDFSLEEFEKIEKPFFQYRQITYLTFMDPEFSMFTKQNMNPFSEPELGGAAGKLSTAHATHTFYDLIPPKKYYKDHPEYYALINGKRVAGRMSQLCLSNPDVLELAAEHVIEWFKHEPDVLSMGLIPNDAAGYCECERCKEMEKKFGGKHSGPIINLCNYVAKRLQKELPGKFVHTIAYTYYLEPPENITIEPNVMVAVCDMYPECQDNVSIGESPRTEKIINVIKGWRKLTDNVLVWHYIVDFVHFNLTPFPNVKPMQKTLQTYYNLGVKGVLMQADTQPGVHGEFEAFKNWYFSKLLWNPFEDYSDEIRKFIKNYYGPCEELVMEYLGECEKLGEDPTTDIHLYSGLEGIPSLTRDFIKNWQERFEGAIDRMDKLSNNLSDGRSGKMDNDYGDGGPEALSEDERRYMTNYIKHCKKVLFDLDYTYLLFPPKYWVDMGYIFPEDLEYRKKVLERFKKGLSEFEIGVVSESLPVSLFLERQEFITRKNSILVLAELAPVIMSQLDSLFSLIVDKLDEKGNFRPLDFVNSCLIRGFQPFHLNNWSLQPRDRDNYPLAEWTPDADIWTRKLNLNGLNLFLRPDPVFLTKNDIPPIVLEMLEGLHNQYEPLDKKSER